MAEKTTIAWCDHTFNPWIGCTKVGPGCDHCYAEVRDARRQWDGGKVHWGVGVPRYRTSESNWSDVKKWDRKAAAAGARRRVFCSSLADVFDNEVPDYWRDDLWILIEDTPNLSWLLVTKRIGNVIRFIPSTWLKNGFPPNVRLLITVCNQEEADRDIQKLLALPCKNGISYEPALGPIDWTFWLPFIERGLGGNIVSAGGVQWVIVGGESTQGAGKARPFDREWAYRTIRQCKDACVPVFVKQMGSNVLARNDAKGCDVYAPHFIDRAGADPAEWPEDLRVQEFPA
jgi:protein gp37